MDIKELDEEIKALDERIRLEGNVPMTAKDIELDNRAFILEVRTILQRLMEGN